MAACISKRIHLWCFPREHVFSASLFPILQMCPICHETVNTRRRRRVSRRFTTKIAELCWHLLFNIKKRLLKDLSCVWQLYCQWYIGPFKCRNELFLLFFSPPPVFFPAVLMTMAASFCMGPSSSAIVHLIQETLYSPLLNLGFTTINYRFFEPRKGKQISDFTCSISNFPSLGFVSFGKNIYVVTSLLPELFDLYWMPSRLTIANGHYSYQGPCWIWTHCSNGFIVV